MHRVLKIALTLLSAFVIAGCANLPSMPLADANAALDASKPIYLMSVTVRNDYKTRWQPRVLNVLLARDGAQGVERKVFRMDDRGTVETDDSGAETFLVRFTTDGPGTYLWGMNAMAKAFPVIGYFYVPVNAAVPDRSSGVHYLGAVKAVVRERKDTEFRAGAVIPLIDQAVSGASSGTFDIEIKDSFDADVKRFREAFPALNNAPINKALLPPWDRTKAQSAWEKS